MDDVKRRDHVVTGVGLFRQIRNFERHSVTDALGLGIDTGLVDIGGIQIKPEKRRIGKGLGQFDGGAARTIAEIG